MTLHYDQLGRLVRIWQPTPSPGAVTMLQWDGVDLVAEYSPYRLLRRYVHGPGTDEPIVWYEGNGAGCLPSPGAGGCDRRFLARDERNSIVAVSDSAGVVLATNTYDEYGIPGTSNMGRFQYTGQLWLPEIGMYYYKARIYSPTLGRFLQTDPIGYADGMNWYAYVGGDPVNYRDPLGLLYQCNRDKSGNCWKVETDTSSGSDSDTGDIVVTGSRHHQPNVGGTAGFDSGFGDLPAAAGISDGGPTRGDEFRSQSVAYQQAPRRPRRPPPPPRPLTPNEESFCNVVGGIAGGGVAILLAEIPPLALVVGVVAGEGYRRLCVDIISYN